MVMFSRWTQLDVNLDTIKPRATQSFLLAQELSTLGGNKTMWQTLAACRLLERRCFSGAADACHGMREQWIAKPHCWCCWVDGVSDILKSRQTTTIIIKYMDEEIHSSPSPEGSRMRN
ncbi:hypothetical protein, variant [Cladophialophora immunda]|uniref:Uncharacterized protein n=1 Tax=Cladophialophora immunda TaxID=569365 RepID=A0A0D2C034_9EURO|nr:uncharacterized protein PV07_10413 [Cladophialophora immunda]XP_016244930.1 hypothetical protein, variant [Cladophialophora immunda]KIW24713.1 hypothetical protein PV07_10413 [Cladophialophora immunda]KIW24714.1 hypothetical protein, variant [Cladophialophora immunda]